MSYKNYHNAHPGVVQIVHCFPSKEIASWESLDGKEWLPVRVVNALTSAEITRQAEMASYRPF